MTVLTVDARADWWSEAACQSVDPDLFFPLSPNGKAPQQIAEAKAVCAGCQVRPQCLNYALAAEPLHGIWAGTTEGERRRLRQSPGLTDRRAARDDLALSGLIDFDTGGVS